MHVRPAGVISAKARRAVHHGSAEECVLGNFSPATLLLLTAAALGGCSDVDAPDPKYGVSASPRVVAGRAVAKGGGDYKVGRPYKVAGRWYVPREVASYDRTGRRVVVWLGLSRPSHRQRRDLDMGALTAGTSDAADTVLCLRHRTCRTAVPSWSASTTAALTSTTA